MVAGKVRGILWHSDKAEAQQCGGRNNVPVPCLCCQQIPSGSRGLLAFRHCKAQCLPCTPPTQECMPLWPGGSLARCANTLAALGQLVVYTGVCEFSQTSQTRIRTNSGGNQCSNIETQGFLRERETKETKRPNRCHGPCGFHFLLPWLLSNEFGACPRPQFRQPTRKQHVMGSLVAVQGRSHTEPCMVAGPDATSRAPGR